MRLININSKRGIVNLLSDFIVRQIGTKSNTIIQVTDLNHFFLINGITESKTILDLSKIMDDFYSENKTLLKDLGYSQNMNTMDLIQYNKKIIDSDVRYLWYKFYNSDRPVYRQEVIENRTSFDILSTDYDNGIIYEIDYNSVIIPSKFVYSPTQITSEFPYGYSFPMGRTLFYYSEYIANQIIKPSMSNELYLMLTNKKNEDGETIIEVNFNSLIPTESIKSMILDVFDFDYHSFESEFLNNYDICDDIKKPTEGKPWLVNDKDPKDLIVF